MGKKTDSTEVAERHRFVSDRELETITGVKRRTWQKHRLFGKGPRFYRIGGSVRYDLAEVMEWIRSNAVGGGQAA